MGPVLRDYRAVRRAYRPGNTGRYYVSAVRECENLSDDEEGVEVETENSVVVID